MDFSMFLVFPGILITIGVVLLLLSIIIVIIAYKTADVNVPEPSQLDGINYVSPQNNGDYISDTIDESIGNGINGNITSNNSENINNNIDYNTNYSVNNNTRETINDNNQNNNIDETSENVPGNNINDNINTQINADINNNSFKEENSNSINNISPNLEETKVFKFPKNLEPNLNEEVIKPEITNNNGFEANENNDAKIDIFETEFNSFEEKPVQKIENEENRQTEKIMPNNLYQNEEDEEEIEIL